MSRRLLPCLLLLLTAAAAAELNVVQQGADPTGQTDCTELLTRLHATGQGVYYPEGSYRFNGPTLDLSGGVRFESLRGVTVRNDISDENILQFDDAGHLIGLQQNHLEQDETTLGGPLPMTVGSLVSPPVSTANPTRRVDLLAHWYNDFGLEHRRLGAATKQGWIGWYYWTWNFHRDTKDGYDPSRHPLLGFYRGDDPVVLDWQCYWLREYAVAGAILYLGSPPLTSPRDILDGWSEPSHPAYWVHQLFHRVPNFEGLPYVMTGYAPWSKNATPEQQERVEASWRWMIEATYLKYPHAYCLERDGQRYPVVYVHAESALRGVFDNYRGAQRTVEFYGRIAKLFQAAGYGGFALLARYPMSAADAAPLAGLGVLHYNASYSVDSGEGNSYEAHVNSFNPPTDPHTILNVVTARHTHSPHPSRWVCPGSTPALFEQMLRKATAHLEEHGQPRVITCYNMAEWAEGGPGLQPNLRDRFGYLEAVKRVVTEPAP